MVSISSFKALVDASKRISISLIFGKSVLSVLLLVLAKWYHRLALWLPELAYWEHSNPVQSGIARFQLNVAEAPSGTLVFQLKLTC